MIDTVVHSKPYWRIQEAQIVAELFPVTSTDVWNDLLDLHSQLLHGRDLQILLDQFLKCRHAVEADHYIPFYRLRRLIEGSLRLSATVRGQQLPPQLVPIRPILWDVCRSLAEVQKKLRRQRFEHDLSFSENDSVCLTVEEFISPVWQNPTVAGVLSGSSRNLAQP